LQILNFSGALMRARFGETVVLIAAALLVMQDAPAQIYPARAVRIVVASTPGSSPDVVARLLAQKLTERLGQQVVVDNRAGVGGNLGAEAVARAAADGYTLLLVMSSHAIGMALYKSLNYDLARDLVAVAPIASTPTLLVAHPALPATSVKALIALAKARPNELLLGSGGAGTPPHLCAEMFRGAARISFVHVPYKGISPALTDVAAGQLQFAFSSLPAVMSYVRSGRLRALGVTTLARTNLAPDVPAIAETLPGFEALGWFGIAAPAGTPPAVIERVHGAVHASMAQPDLIEALRNQGAEPMAGTTAQFGAFVASEIRKWGEVVRAIDLRPE
jgi:tripartite-type tricarboxylate transporter receptor subunit TctC